MSASDLRLIPSAGVLYDKMALCEVYFKADMKQSSCSLSASCSTDAAGS